jgi:hypothetical protein
MVDAVFYLLVFGFKFLFDSTALSPHINNLYTVFKIDIYSRLYNNFLVTLQYPNTFKAPVHSPRMIINSYASLKVCDITFIHLQFYKKKTLSLLSIVIATLLLTVSAHAQVYILNEDFSSATSY